MKQITSSIPDVAGLLAAVESLPPSRLVVFLDGLAGMPCVEAAGWRVREKPIRREKYPDRNREIRRRNAGGRTCGELALDYGLSRSGIAKICQRGRKKVWTSKSCPPPHAD